MTIFIFDLDHTVIDSSHRQLTREDGSLDLAHWIENCSREKIMRDSLLPLAAEMRELLSRGVHVIICTARVLGDADYEFLETHGLLASVVLSRPEGDSSRDHILKENLLRNHALSKGVSFARFCSRCVMFDDNVNVNKHLATFGIKTICAIRANKLLTAA